MATVITAPEKVIATSAPSLFLAGGITGCFDWQADAIDLLQDDDVTILNPRRVDFDVSDPSASDAQIEWEHDALRRSDVILFWFPDETLCPITLYELGTWSVMDTPLVIGTHPDYARRYDVVKQTSLVRPDLLVVSDLLTVVQQARAALERGRPGSLLSDAEIQWLSPPMIG